MHVDDTAPFARRAVEAGARQVHTYSDLVMLRSPSGLPWCVVGYSGERDRPAPQPIGVTGCLNLVDQLCIDIPASRFDEECVAFWSQVPGWEQHQSRLRAGVPNPQAP